jgi:hypothetical protein
VFLSKLSGMAERVPNVSKENLVSSVGISISMTRKR